MARIINASIELTKIDKTKIVEKDGRKWYGITITINDEKDKYENDCSISTNQTKEEREAKAPKVYLGNGKTVWQSEPKSDIPKTTVISEVHTFPPDDLPF